jgi:CBS domain-containing protein
MTTPRRDDPLELIVTGVPVTVGPEQTLADVHALFEREKIHHLPVVQDGRFLGILSVNDLWRVFGADPYQLQDPATVDSVLSKVLVRDAMQEDVVTVQRTETLYRGAELLRDGSFHALPVLDGDKLVGMLTTTDLIDCLLSLF